MRQVTLSARVPQADAAKVFDLLADFPRYPEFTDAVRKVDVVRSAAGVLDSTWEVNFRNGVLCWAECDVLDPVGQSISFEQTRGDFDRFDGGWLVRQSGTDVVIHFAAVFDLGMPSLDPIIGPIAERTLLENLRRILVGLTGPATEFSEGTHENALGPTAA